MHRHASDWAGNIAAFALVILVNGPINAVLNEDQSIGEISASFPTLFTPAGFTFAIWGLIYLALFAFIIYQALPAQREQPMLASIGLPFKLSCLANAGWIIAWHYQIWSLSLLLMAVILISLVVIYRRLNIAYRPPYQLSHLLLFAPFSLYCGWITVASLANISVVQAATGTEDWALSELDWTLLKLALAGAIGAIVVQRRRDTVFILVICWAAAGIVAGQQANPAVVGAAAVVAVLGLMLAMATGAGMLWRR